ncbi:peptidyl-prolyl cis-trans isomerase [Deferribacteraceae bacterium V6Fe1]|nr:peptidyl-prolyl cis-trans isomerase [Deferribacteraceae bacterium V6Fe1]
MLCILRLVRILTIIISLAISVSVFASDIVATVDNTSITQFEVNSFVNTVLPIGKFHGASLNKADYWKDAFKAAVESRKLNLYLQKNEPAIYKKAEEKANNVIKDIRKRFKSDNEFNEALAQNNITEKDLLLTHIDLNVKNALKEAIESTDIPNNQLLDYYNNNKDMFNLGSSWFVENCLIEADARNLKPEEMKEKEKFASEIKQRLQNGDKSALKECSDKKYPKEERVYRFSKNYPIRDIEKLEQGQYGGPYKNIFGFLIVHVKEELPAEIIPFQEVKEEIKRIMYNSIFKKRYAEIMEKADDTFNVKIFDNTVNN